MKQLDAQTKTKIRNLIDLKVSNLSVPNPADAYDLAYDILEEIDENNTSLRACEENEDERWFDNFVGETAEKIVFLAR